MKFLLISASVLKNKIWLCVDIYKLMQAHALDFIFRCVIQYREKKNLT